MFRFRSILVPQMALCAAVAILLSGCVRQPPPPPAHYAKAGATQEQFMKDRYACVLDAQQGRSAAVVGQYGGSSYGTVVTSRGVFTSCMAARGYNIDPNGPLVTPPEALIYMVN
jgi:hypothetical protein